MGARRARERNTKLLRRWIKRARTGVCRSYAFTATVRGRRRRWNRKRNAKSLFGNGTPYSSFCTDWEKNSEGNFNGTWNNYQNLEEFEELFRGHFRDFLGRRVDQETGQKLLSRKVRRWKSSPFRGLNVFDFEHAPIFHGRTRAIGEVLEALEGQVRAQRPFVLIVGASGSGKSSLVRAGVLPLLTQPETIEGVGLWRWSVTRPGAGGSGGDCFDALAAALLEPSALPALEDPESRNAVRDLGSELREHSDSVALRVRDALDHAAREWKIQRCHSLEEKERQLRGSGRSDEADVARQQRERFELPKARLALVVDQLEELFTSWFFTGGSAEVYLRARWFGSERSSLCPGDVTE